MKIQRLSYCAVAVLVYGMSWTPVEARAMQDPEQGRVQQDRGRVQEDEPELTETERLRYATLAARTDYEENVSEELEKAEEEIDELSQQYSIPVNGQKLAFLRDAVDELEELHEKAVGSLERLTALDGEAWLLARRKVESNVDALWSALQETKSRLGLT